MGFEEDPNDREANYPCDCGGSITRAYSESDDPHGDPPEPIGWDCDKCGKRYIPPRDTCGAMVCVREPGHPGSHFTAEEWAEASQPIKLDGAEPTP